MRKEAIQILHIQEELGRYSHKLSIISKQSKLMQKELRYQVKIQAISDMPRKEKISCNFSPKFFIFIYFIKQNIIWK
jgi:5-formaminoimidazole-4-carboxamide-1-beta-D-ribofuranosyl 5'-monophosphate synthetase